MRKPRQNRYKTGEMKTKLVLSRRQKIAVLAVTVVGAALAIWALDPYRKVPFARSLSPVFWVQHARGLDLYDPQSALLEHGDAQVPEVALTFDDGPDPRYGPAIAALLKQRGVTATFFVIGFRVRQYPQVLRELAADGFEIGNHTYDHQRLPPLKPHEIANELRLGDRDIATVIGRHTTLMRPPGVEYDDKVLGVAKSLGYVTVSWTVGRARLWAGAAGVVHRRARPGPDGERLHHPAAPDLARDIDRPTRHH